MNDILFTFVFNCAEKWNQGQKTENREVQIIKT